MSELDEIPHVNGSRRIETDAAVPEQRQPADAAPPGVWLGSETPPDLVLDDQDDDRDDLDDLGPLLPEVIRAPGRFTAQHVRHVATGARIYAARRRDARSTARHERMMRIAEAQGDHATALEWETRAAAFRKERHARRMALLRAPVYAAKAVIYTAGILGGCLVTLGLVLAVSSHNPHEAGVPLHVGFRVIWWVCWAISMSWRPALVAAPALILASLWALGRSHAPIEPVLYLDDEDGDGRELVPDESAILSALRNLNLGPMNKAVREGWQPRWVLGAVEEGNGWHAQLMLPQGVNVEMINGKKNLLASNLLRQPIEVWPSEPRNKPGVLDLWVAHPNTLTGPVPPWPLLKSGTVDYFKGVPVALSLRGEPIRAQLMARNYMIGGIMGTGKSSATRDIVLGAALDPLVEIEVYVFAHNADYDAMRPRLATLVKGDDDDEIEMALHALRRLRSEVTRRGQILSDMRERGLTHDLALTREIALRDKRMRPRLVVFDECHELFMHKTHGAEAAELAEKVMKKARKTGITLIWVTVSPTKDSIPKEVTRNTSNRVAFAVGDHFANDGLLGTGKHRAGITATTLNPGTDIGTSVTVGFTVNPFDIARWQYVPDEQVPPVIERACKAREGLERAALERAPAEPIVDPIADIATLLGDAPRMRTQEVLEGLRALRPGHYRDWDFRKLTAALRAVGAEPYTSSGIANVDAGKVRAALADRAEDIADEPEDDPDDADFE
jgi:S-DNA-T family DNA segregation ATPase FtsK/SpoIIIE